MQLAIEGIKKENACKVRGMMPSIELALNVFQAIANKPFILDPANVYWHDIETRRSQALELVKCGFQSWLRRFLSKLLNLWALFSHL